MPVADDAGIDEVLVEVVDELDDPVLPRAADGNRVEGGEVLHELAQADAPGVGADGELGVIDVSCMRDA